MRGDTTTPNKTSNKYKSRGIRELDVAIYVSCVDLVGEFSL